MPEPSKPTAVATRAPAKVAPTKPAPEPAADGGEPTGRFAWFLGWVVVPGTVVGGIFGAGALLGAHRPEGWFAKSVIWVVGLF
jgi:hypothetical protein